MNLALIMMFAGWQPNCVGVQPDVKASAERTGLEAAQAQTTTPCSGCLLGSPELWKFRLFNAGAIGAR